MGLYNDRILIADGHARQALALAKSFHELGCFVTVVCESRLDVCFQSRFVDKKIVNKDIKTHPKLRVQCIINEISLSPYTLVVACSDITAEQISLHRDKILKYAETSVVEKNKFYKAFDKQKTMEICMKYDIPCPKTYFNCKTVEDVINKKLEYPIIIKPRSGYGAIGFKKFDTEEKLKRYLQKNPKGIENLVIQEYIPQTDIQYEVAMFLDYKKQIKSAMVFEKNRWFPIHGGSSTLNTSVKDEEIVSNCSILLKQIGWIGCADIDLIRDPRDGIAKIMEINPRMSGSAKIVILSGVNLSLQLLQMARGENVTEYKTYKEGIRLRCFYTDFLWFLISKNRFKSKPSWFDFRNTHDQIFSIVDPLPFISFSISSFIKLKKELKKRHG